MSAIAKCNIIESQDIIYIWRVGEWLLLNAYSASFQQYYGENKLIFNEMMMMIIMVTIETIART
jgi:hypothetical protein